MLLPTRGAPSLPSPLLPHNSVFVGGMFGMLGICVGMFGMFGVCVSNASVVLLFWVLIINLFS